MDEAADDPEALRKIEEQAYNVVLLEMSGITLEAPVLKRGRGRIHSLLQSASEWWVTLAAPFRKTLPPISIVRNLLK